MQAHALEWPFRQVYQETMVSQIRSHYKHRCIRWTLERCCFLLAGES